MKTEEIFRREREAYVAELQARLLGCLPPDCYQLSPDSSEMLERFWFLFVRETGGARLDILLADNAFDSEAVGRSRRVDVLARCESDGMRLRT